MSRARRGATIGAGAGAILAGIVGILLGILAMYNACGNTTDVNVYGFCATRLLGIPVSAALGALLGLCPAIFVGALIGGSIGVLIGYSRREDGPTPSD
jgi:hypothetical protein